MSESRLFREAARFRRRLIDRENVAIEQVVAALSVAQDSIARRLLALLLQMADEAPNMPVSWLLTAGRLETLLAQSTAELVEWSGLAASYVRAGQSDAVAMAAEAALSYAQIRQPGIVDTWDRVPLEALQSFVGFSRDGSPLREVFGRYGFQAAQELEDGITSGLALGQNPREVAREIASVIAESGEMPPGYGDGISGLQRLRKKVEVTTRTEIIRAHKDAAIANYAENDDIVQGYERISARDSRVCAVCWALDGTFYEEFVLFEDHPQCRCTAIPVIGGDRLRVTGPAAFSRLDADAQKEILGPSRYALYQEGASLGSFVKRVDDPDWGPQVRLKPLAG